MKTTQPIVGGVAVARVVAVPFLADDDAMLNVDGVEGWRVVGRARVDFPQGGLANGLMLERDACGGVERACVIWERPREGGAGKFRLLPVGDWS